MHKNHFLVLIIFFVALCGAMERSNKIEITVVKNPYRAQYLTKNHIVVADENGCSIVDYLTNKKVKQLNTINYGDKQLKSSGLEVFPKEQKIVSFWDKTVAIYDAQTGKEQWLVTQEKIIRGCVCKPSDNIIFLCYGYPTLVGDQKGREDSRIIKYNYVTNDVIEFSIASQNCQNIALHPRGKKIVIGDSFGFISIAKVGDLPLISKKIQLPEAGFWHVQYNFDGSYFALADSMKIVVINSKNYDQFPIKYGYGKFNSIVFLPNSSILAVLLRAKTIIEYWDIKAKKLICGVEFDAESSHNISSSLEEAEVIVIQQDKCVIFRAPPKIFWHNKYPYFLFLLKNYLNQHHEMPGDIAGYIMKTAYEI